MERALDVLDAICDIAYFGGAAVLLTLLLVMAATTPARGQEHEHGADGLPDWYDTDCCNKQDCRPVDDSTIEFTVDKDGKPVVIYTEPERPGRKGEPLRTYTYSTDRWRPTKDGRYHACYRGDKTVYCVYIKLGA